MAAAVYDTLSVVIEAGEYTFRAVGSQLKFAGYLSAYSTIKKKAKEEDDANEDAENAALDKDKILPELTVGQDVKLTQTLPKQHFTEPPPRFSEATLVKAMEEKGIGRPSTYAPTIDTIVSRGYVARIEKKFEPTELGFVVVDLLKEYFEKIVDVEFTAGMEDRLDGVAEGEISWENVLKDFYGPFSQELAVAEEAIGQIELPVQVSDVACENCGQMMVIKQGRYGDFLACPGFPKCRNTKPILKSTGAQCPKCGGEIVERRSKRGRVFYGCAKYPECDFTSWDAPLNEKCPECGSFMIKPKTKNSSEIIRCANPECASNANLAAAPEKPAAAKRKRSKKSG
jgi:DNA topoisomerase-1